MSDSSLDSSSSATHYLALAIATAVTALYLPAQSDLRLAQMLSSGLQPVLAFAALVTAVATLAQAGSIHEKLSKVWLLVQGMWLGYTVGILLWFVAETFSSSYLLLSTPRSYPSIGDLFWLSGFFSFLVALFLQAWPFREAFSSRNLVIVSGVALTIAVLVFRFYYPVLENSTRAFGLPTQIITVLYLILDLALLSVAIPVAVFFSRGTIWKPFLLIMLGIILGMLGNVVYGWAYLTARYYEGHPLNLLYLWSYLALALGFYLRFQQGRKFLAEVQ